MLCQVGMIKIGAQRCQERRANKTGEVMDKLPTNQSRVWILQRPKVKGLSFAGKGQIRRAAERGNAASDGVLGIFTLPP